MSIRRYLDSQPFSEMIPYRADNASDCVAFVGALRKHPYDDEKCLLIAEPSGCDPAIFEFRIVDVLGADEMPSPVDEEGQSLSLVKLWIKRGSFGIRYEPFEVDEPIRRSNESAPIKQKFLKTVSCWG
jgi:inorganic pyrophosphatase